MALAQYYHVGIQIDAQDALPFQARLIGDCASSWKNAGIDQEQVDAAEVAHPPFDCRVDRVLVANIATQAEEILALVQPGDRRVDIQTDNGRTACGERRAAGPAA